jgi:hypothetical protein
MSQRDEQPASDSAISPERAGESQDVIERVVGSRAVLGLRQSASPCDDVPLPQQNTDRPPMNRRGSGEGEVAQP